MALTQVESIIGTSFIPDPVETEIVSVGEAVRVPEVRQPNGLYEALLLAVSFIFLLFGVLPSQPEPPLGAGAPGEATGKTASS